MSNEEFDLTADVEAAWAKFRGRLADRLAVMEDDDILFIEAQTGVDEDELEGAAPYLQFCAFGGDLVQSEAVSNTYLDERYQLAAQDEVGLLEIGWDSPRFDEEGAPVSGWANFHHGGERRDADRLAVMSVRALREVYGVAHPAFLDADGLELDPDQTVFPDAGDLEEGEQRVTDEDVATFAQDQGQLQELVDAALAVMKGGPVEHDADGDVAIRAGQSCMFVRVLPDRPAIEIFAEVVLGVQDVDRLHIELDLLNRSHPFAKFFCIDDRVLMKHALCAAPFAPSQLRALLAHLLEEIDDLSRDLALRVDGRRFFDPEDYLFDEDDSDDSQQPSASLVALLEILHVRTLAPAAVAALFDHDRGELVRLLVGLRTGEIDCSEHPLDLVLDHLRRGLGYVAQRAARPEPGRRTVPPRPRTQQLALLADEATLDAGVWDQDVS